MKFIYIAFALAVFTTAAAAQEKKEGAALSSTLLVMNGQPIRGKVLEIDGKHYVAVEDLAQSLRGTIAYGDGQIVLTWPKLTSGAPQSAVSSLSSTTGQASSSPMPTITAQPLETGAVKGTLTYFFDFHSGNKPDSGAKIWLVKGHAEIPANQNLIATSSTLGTSVNPQEYNVSQYVTANENGNFEMLSVPAGEYTLVLQSAHTKWTLNDRQDFFGRGNGHNPRDSSGRVEFLSLIVKPGETAEASKDFGPDIDK